MSHSTKRILSGMVSFLVVLLLLEGISRIAATVIHDYWSAKAANVDMWYELSPDLGWVNEPGFKGDVAGAGVQRAFDKSGMFPGDSLYRSGSRRWKVAFIGDSNTFGFGVPEESTFVELLPALDPDISTINLGVPGYTSYQGLQALRKVGVAVRPDLIVVSFNFNDRRLVLDRESVDGAKHFQKVYRQARQQEFRELLRVCYLSRGLEHVLGRLGLLENDTEPYKKEVRIDTLHARVGPESYRENLVAIVQTARTENIKVVFMLLKDNPVQTAYLDKGISEFEHGEYDAAIESLKTSNRLSNWCSVLARKYLSKAYAEKGMNKEAKKALLLDIKDISLHGGPALYRDREYNQIMREVAAEYNVGLIDATSVLDAHPSTYTDSCHFDEQGHRAVANLLSTRLEEILEMKGHQLGTWTH
jgi:lysophospholipase L1-like esterase